MNSKDRPSEQKQEERVPGGEKRQSSKLGPMLGFVTGLVGRFAQMHSGAHRFNAKFETFVNNLVDQASLSAEKKDTTKAEREVSKTNFSTIPLIYFILKEKNKKEIVRFLNGFKAEQIQRRQQKIDEAERDNAESMVDESEMLASSTKSGVFSKMIRPIVAGSGKKRKKKAKFHWSELWSEIAAEHANSEDNPHYAFALYVATGLRDNPEVRSIVSEALVRSMSLEQKHNKGRVDGNLEHELSDLLKVLGGVIVDMEKDPNIAETSHWENVPQAPKINDDESPHEKDLPHQEAAIDSSSSSEEDNSPAIKKEAEDVKRALVYLGEIVLSVIQNAQYALKSMSHLYEKKEDNREQRYIPELIALSEFDKRDIVLNHLRASPDIVALLTHIFKEKTHGPEDKQQKSLVKAGLYQMVKGLVIGKIPPENSLEWVDLLLNNLRYESEEELVEGRESVTRTAPPSGDAELVINNEIGREAFSERDSPEFVKRNRGRSHIIDIAIHQMFPNIQGQDLDVFKGEFEKLISEMDGLANILGHITPEMFHILRKPENQPHIRTLVDVVLYNMYAYTPSQLHRADKWEPDVESTTPYSFSSEETSLDVSSTESTATTKSTMSSIFAPAKEVATGAVKVLEGVAKGAVSLPRVLKGSSSSAQERDWSKVEGHSANFSDALMHYVLNAPQYSDKELSELLKDIHKGDVFRLLQRLFDAKEGQYTQDNNPDRITPAQQQYDKHIVEHFLFDKGQVAYAPGLLQFVSKIVMQVFPDPQIAQITSFSERLKRQQEQEDILTNQLWELFVNEPRHIIHERLSCLTEGLADFSAGHLEKDDARTAQGLHKILSLLPFINEKVIESDKPNYFIDMISKNLWEIPESFCEQQRAQEQSLQLKVLKMLIKEMSRDIESNTGIWAHNLNQLIKSSKCSSYNLVPQLIFGSDFLKLSMTQMGALCQTYNQLSFNEQRLLVQRFGVAGHALAMASLAHTAFGYSIVGIQSLEALLTVFSQAVAIPPVPHDPLDRMEMNLPPQQPSSGYVSSLWGMIFGPEKITSYPPAVPPELSHRPQMPIEMQVEIKKKAHERGQKFLQGLSRMSESLSHLREVGSNQQHNNEH